MASRWFERVHDLLREKECNTKEMGVETIAKIRDCWLNDFTPEKTAEIVSEAS